MSLYKTHARLNILLILPLLLGLVVYLIQLNYGFLMSFAIAFIYGSLFLGPDLDIADKIKLLSWRGLFTLPFRPYAKIFRHRGISHSILLGTATRLIYLMVVAALICYAINRSLLPLHNIKEFILHYRTHISWMLLGLFLADLFHVLVDRLTPKRSKN